MEKNDQETQSECGSKYSNIEREQALELLKAPDLKDLYLNICHTQYLGRDNELLLIKLATISRRMKRGVSVVITGTSSVGKSELLNTVLKTVDPEDKCDFTRITPQYLLYTLTSLDHKLVTFYEITGANETFHLLRTALSEGQLSLGTVQNNTKQGLHAEDLKKSSEGMVMLTTFASGKVDHELNTRIIIMEITHDQQLAKQVLRLKAGQVRTNDQDFKIWKIADSLISPLDVVIPYADKLAELFPVHEERFMRDFDKLLTLIRASALWHQYQREKDEAGCLVASEEDYWIVYSLRGLITQTVSSISDPVKDFLKNLESFSSPAGIWVNREELRVAMGVSSATIKRYVKTALEGEYIEVTGRGKKQKLRIIEMPDMVSPLPTPETIWENTSELMSQDM